MRSFGEQPLGSLVEAGRIDKQAVRSTGPQIFSAPPPPEEGRTLDDEVLSLTPATIERCGFALQISKLHTRKPDPNATANVLLGSSR